MKTINANERNLRKCHCMVCGRTLKKGEGFKINHKQKGFAYVCERHNNDLGYCDAEAQSQETVGTVKKGMLQRATIGIELETSWITEELTGRLQSNDFQRTQDGTVYRELKSPVWQGLSSPSKIFNLLDEQIKEGNLSTEDTDIYTVGTHLNIGYECFKGIGMDIITSYYTQLFFPLSDYIARLDEEKQWEIFGRAYGEWARPVRPNCDIYDAKEHTNAFNIQHDDHIEYRLPRYINKTQFMTLVRCFREITCEIAKFIEMYTSGNLPDNFIEEFLSAEARKTGRKLVKIFRKYYC